MNAFVLHDDDHDGMARWSASAAVIILLHAAVIALGIAWYAHLPPSGVALPTIMIDLAPAPSPSAPVLQPLDLPPAPEMQEADPPPPPPEPPKQEAVQEQLAPTPPQPSPLVEAPPEPKAEPVPPKPEPAQVVPDRPKPVPIKPKPLRPEAKPADAPPAPRSSAAPKAERRAPSTSAETASAGANLAAALSSYNQRVAAHLQRFKQYPPGGDQGTSRLSFTLGRGGQVLGSRLAGSSGHPSLDNETLAMVRRAQPFPPMPPELKQASMSFSVPVRFLAR
jgi:protein TonB